MISLEKSAVTLLALLPFVLSPVACNERKSREPIPASPPARASAKPETAAALSPSVAPSASAPLASSLPVADESLAGQLVMGFYAIEQQSWRWTGPEFSVKLAVPPGAKEKGAILRLKFTVPKQRPTFALTGKVADAKTTKTYSKSGDYVFELEVPAAALTTDSVVAEFGIDKPFTPGGGDVRLLGVVATSVELLPKS